jgi:hypothetical protein
VAFEIFQTSWYWSKWGLSAENVDWRGMTNRQVVTLKKYIVVAIKCQILQRETSRSCSGDLDNASMHSLISIVWKSQQSRMSCEYLPLNIYLWFEPITIPLNKLADANISVIYKSWWMKLKMGRRCETLRHTVHIDMSFVMFDKICNDGSQAIWIIWYEGRLDRNMRRGSWISRR